MVQKDNRRLKKIRKTDSLSNHFCFFTNVLSNGYRTISFYFVIQNYGVYFHNNGIPTDTTDVKWMFIPVCSFHGLEAGLTRLPRKNPMVTTQAQWNLRKPLWAVEPPTRNQVATGKLEVHGPLCKRATLNNNKILTYCYCVYLLAMRPSIFQLW